MTSLDLVDIVNLTSLDLVYIVYTTSFLVVLLVSFVQNLLKSTSTYNKHASKPRTDATVTVKNGFAKIKSKTSSLTKIKDKKRLLSSKSQSPLTSSFGRKTVAPPLRGGGGGGGGEVKKLSKV